MTLTVDDQWLKDPSRVYPVTIDPIVSIEGVNQFHDTYVQERGKHPQSTDFMIYVGYDDGVASRNWELYKIGKKEPEALYAFNCHRN